MSRQGRHQMNEQSKTKQELIEEISVLKQKNRALEQSESDHRRVEKELEREQSQIFSIFDQMSAEVSVLDPLTYEILFANRYARELYGQDILGRFCYDVFHGYEAPCRSCNNEHLLGKSDDEFIQREVFSEPVGRHYLTVNHLIRWPDGRRVKLEISFDTTDKKWAEEALRESEERFRRVSSTISDIAYSCSTNEDGRFVIDWITGATERISGYSIPEIKAQECWGFLVVEEDRALFKKNVTDLPPGAYGSCELRIRHMNDDIRWIASSAECIAGGETPERHLLYGALVDITERKNEAENKRRAQERADLLAAEMEVLAEIGRVIGSSLDIHEVYEPFAAMVRKLIPCDSLMVNLYERERDVLTIAYISGVDITARRLGDLIPLKGSVAEVIIHKKRGVLLQPESTEEMLQEFPHLVHVFQAGLISMISVPLISADRVIGVLVFRSKKRKAYTEQDLCLAERIGMQIAGAIANAHLFSDLKMVEQSLRESEEHYRRITQAVTDYIYTVRVEDGRPVETSHGPGCLAVTGYTTEEFVMDPYLWIRMVVPEDRPLVQDQVQRVLAGAETPVLEHRIIRKDGVERWIRNTSVSHRDKEHRLISYDGLVQDITEHKRAEEEKRSLEERLQRAEKMEALGQLAGGVAHDLNNVLGVVIGYAELLTMRISEGDPTRGYADKILTSTEKAASIIQDLLTLARRGVTVSEVINLNSVVSSFQKTPVFEKLRDYHPSVTFSTECDQNLLNIKGSPVHLEKTLMNLVSNAAESISGKGEVTIRTENLYLDKAIRGYDEVKEGDYAVLTVSDTGMGIPAENREKIFEPFYTKKTMGRSGTGLGLAIVWGTVKDHNGYIDVQTKVGEGTTFRLYFPVAREELIAQQQKAPIERYMGRGESVLVVDDIAEQREMAETILRGLGYQVRSVFSGEEAVEYLKGNKADILVLDMIMAPGIDGLETYRRVLETNPSRRRSSSAVFQRRNGLGRPRR